MEDPARKAGGAESPASDRADPSRSGLAPGEAALDAVRPDRAPALPAPALSAPDSQRLIAAQAHANLAAGPRSLPSRVISVPTHLDPATAALAAAPYGPFWNTSPADDQHWRETARRAAEQLVPIIADVRERLSVTVERTTVGGVNAYLLTPRHLLGPRRDQLVLHLHGGGYVLGAGLSGTMQATLLAAFGGVRVLSLDYRLPPDAPHPAALEDAVAAWRAALRTTEPRRIAVEGISAGGGLALALMLHLKAERLPLPAALVLGSPWSDLTATGDSYQTNEWLDNVIVSYDAYLGRAARLYAGGHDLRHPSLSPVYGDLSGLPPTVLFTGTRDLFLSNTVRVHRKLRAAGVVAELHVHEALSHSQHVLNPGAAVTQDTYREIAHFLDRYLID